MQRQSLAVGAGWLSVTLALLLWSLAAVQPASAGRDEQTERPERGGGQIAMGRSSGNGERDEKMNLHRDDAYDDDGDDESDHQYGNDNLLCHGRLELVRIEEKVCPPTPHRPAIVVKRACCRDLNGRVHCRGFRHCPKTSPS